MEISLKGYALNALGWCSCLKKKKNSAQTAFVCINPLLTKLEVKIAVYLPNSFLRQLWTETKSRFDERAEKNSGNDGPILPVRGANQSTGFRFILPSCEYNHIIRIFYFNLVPRSVMVSDVGQPHS